MADTVTVANAPLHKIGVAEDDATSSVGSDTVTEVVAEHPFTSVTV